MSTLPPDDVQEPIESPSQQPGVKQPAKKHKKKLWIIIIAIVIVLLAAGVVGYFMMTKNQAAPIKDVTKSGSTKTGSAVSPPVAEAPIKCADSYRAFADKDTGMAFCYPTEWGDASVHNASVGPSDTGHRQSIAFSANTFFSVGGTSDDWSTTIGRGVGCLEPNNAALPLSAYDTTWHDLVGSGASTEFATRSLPAPTGGYDSTETVSNILDSGVCTQAHKVISGSRYRVAFAAYARNFVEASGIITPRLHMDHPEVLFSTVQRQQFDAVMASLVAY